MPASPDGLAQAQSGVLELTVGPLRMSLRAHVTPLGLLALGVMVSGIVASSSAIVWAARRRAPGDRVRRP